MWGPKQRGVGLDLPSASLPRMFRCEPQAVRRRVLASFVDRGGTLRAPQDFFRLGAPLLRSRPGGYRT